MAMQTDLDRIENAIDATISRFSGEAENLLEKLVAVPSVNPEQPGVNKADHLGGESRANKLFATYLSNLGMNIDYVEVEEGRANLVAILRGTGQGRSLAFNGHIDTVAPQEGRFPDPWTAVREGNRLYGLGATDMKAGHAAMWLAIKALDEVGVRLDGDLHIHSVVGEETMSHEIGTTAVLDAGYQVDAAFVPEPTSSGDLLQMSNTAPGNALFAVTVRGKSAHWASRNLAIRSGGGGDSIGVNAIDKAVYVYNAMRQLEEQWGMSKTHPQFLPGAFIIHPGVLKADVGIEAAPYFPDRARFDYLLSFPPGETYEQVKTEVEQHIRASSALDPWLREHPPEFEWYASWPPAFTDPNSEFVQISLAARNAVAPSEYFSAGVIPAGAQSDASFYEKQGIPAVVSGPGDLLRAHAADESVDLDLVPIAARTMARTALRWCSE
ncbi:M20/M25/M40 family metallo-hydrolase [Paramicrobacterium agarici]|uniref:M20/M25/M40 family metallo-hydrolase n=1 Tax=Paramicrobacterium agarici TaxID=630514 RepID=UPI00115382AC|nr:M20/M25/M40 family metallo-hydrolase [Microbacterium agarici]TQO22977.1 acetylornithine deacetylase [Microbacterium agarici]